MSETATATALSQAAGSLDDPKLYLSRELSLLAFQRRVFEEALDPGNKLLERIKFLSILFSNLDEFFMVRVARLVQQIEGHKPDIGPDGKTPSATLEACRAEVDAILTDAYACYNESLLPALRETGIFILTYSELDKQQRKFAADYFHRAVFPVLTPLAFDPGRPFPHISNLSLNIGVVVRDTKRREHFARVKVPGSLPQLVAVPASSPGVSQFVWLDQIITEHCNHLFPGMEVRATYPFHVTRDAEVAIQEAEGDDLLETIEEAVWSRRFRDVVRLQINRSMPDKVLDILKTNLEVDATDVYRVDGPVDLGRLRYLAVDRPDLQDAPYTPATPIALQAKAQEDIFACIRRANVLVHHPYESFQPVIDFLRKAAHDPDVLAMKATLYRSGKKSPIVQALLDGVENGKQVAVLVELKARFDEESNIEWARALEAEGVHVIYGLPGLKVHSKVMMVVRREGDTIRRYMHLGTGNYNPSTAKLYTDLGYFTCNEEIGADVADLFNYLTGYSAQSEFRKLLVAPINMRQRLTELIEREIKMHEQGHGGRLIFKMNALEDPGMMKLIYRASQAGVQIDLLVRGICCIRPGLPSVSETIRVVSIVGRYLEHSRIYYFHNGGNEEVYLGSADLMPRNLNRRVEVLFPVESKHLVKRLKEQILQTYLDDRAQARLMQPDGMYVRLRESGQDPGFNAQAQFMQCHTDAAAVPV